MKPGGPTKFDDSTVLAFAQTFPGLKKAWGTLWGECVKEPFTLAHYRRHLEGKTSLGIYPMRGDSTCRWAAVDVDEGDDPSPAIRVIEALYSLGLHPGVYLERSKGKGWHVWVFLDDWTPSRILRRILREAVASASLDPRTEVFPKQDTIPVREDGTEGFGNYMNLPYFAAAPLGRRAMYDIPTLQPIPLDEWLNSVERFPTDLLDLVIENLPEEAAPLLGRNQAKTAGDLNSLFTAIYPEKFRRAGSGLPAAVGVLRWRGIPEDSAVALLVAWARDHFDPPLPDEEVEKQIRAMYERYGAPDTTRKGFRRPSWRNAHYSPVPPIENQLLQ